MPPLKTYTFKNKIDNDAVLTLRCYTETEAINTMKLYITCPENWTLIK